MATVKLGVEEVACTILEQLGHRLHDAELDYDCFAGVHSFLIEHAGSRFRIQFAEHTLLTKRMEELEETIRQVAERVLANSTVQPLRYRTASVASSN